MLELHARKLLKRYRVTDGRKFKLSDYTTDDTAPRLVDPREADSLLAAGVKRLAGLQERLAANGTWSMLALFQAMDAAGKDGTIKHVMSGVNPQGVEVTAFKAPGPEELGHGFLWRIGRRMPERGRIAVFNRSHYEEVLAVRVHPEILDRQRLPEAVRGKKLWQHRLEDIAAFERYAARQGTVILKFFLHISPGEQKRRLLDRLDHLDKNWKFSANDVAERHHWAAYAAAYEEAIAATATEHAPWFVVPADNKWFAHLVVVEAMVEALRRLDLHPPTLSEDERAGLDAARIELMKET